MNLKQLQKLINITKDKLNRELLNKRILEDSIIQLKSHLDQMQIELATEQKIAVNDIISKMTYENYYNYFTARKSAVEIELHTREQEVIVIRELIRELYTEVKKYEQLIKSVKEKDRIIKKTKEDQEYDEFAIINHLNSSANDK